MKKGTFYGWVPSPVTLRNETGLSGHIRLHFRRAMEGEQNFCIRLACSGINTSEIKECLGTFKAFIEG